LGRFEESAPFFDRAVSWYGNRPQSERATRGHRYGLAFTLYNAGEWEDARELFEALASEFPDELLYRAYLGFLAARRGDREAAERVSAEFAAVDDPGSPGNTTYWRACIAALLGEEEQAVSLLRLAHVEGREFSQWTQIDPDLEPLRGYPPFEEFMRPKG
jgi:predicted Zn-dependent protease